MNKYYILNKAGNPVAVSDVTVWAREFDAMCDRWQVAHTEVNSNVVSTVFLGLDHGFREEPPLIFETMVFGGPLDREQDHYSTREEALAGHAAMVARVKKEKKGTK